MSNIGRENIVSKKKKKRELNWIYSYSNQIKTGHYALLDHANCQHERMNEQT